MIALVGPRLRLSFLILLIVLAMGAPATMGLDEVVDDYENETRVSFTYQVVRNITLNTIELEYGATFEDISTFNEVDVGGDHISLNESTMEWEDQIRNEDTRAWKDYGANFFDDFYIEFTHGYTAIEAGDVTRNNFGMVLVLHNTPGPFINIWGGTALIIYPEQAGANDDMLSYSIRARKGGGTVVDEELVDRGIATFYWIFNRTGTNIDVMAFNDPGRASLNFSLSINAWTDDLRYLSMGISRNAGSDPNDWSSGFIQDMAFESVGYFSEGYFNTTNYLAGLGYNATVLLTDTSIPSGSINAEISPDGTTWSDLGGLDVGRGALDLRDLGLTDAILRFNFTRGLSTETPRLAQVRLIHEGPGTGGPSGPGAQVNVTGSWELYNLTAIGVLVGTHDSGDLNSTLDIDGDSYNVSEVVGAPGFLISFNWTGVDLDADCLWVVINAWYDGNLAHDIDIELYNHTAMAWVDIGHIVDGVGFEWFNASIYGLRIPMDFLNGAGDVWGRLNHVSNGNINHDLFIEYLKLHAFIPSDVTPTVSGALATDVTPFIAIGLILALSMYLLADRIRN